MLNAKRLDEAVRSTEEGVNKAVESLPRWVLWLLLTASVVILITEFWPR